MWITGHHDNIGTAGGCILRQMIASTARCAVWAAALAGRASRMRSNPVHLLRKKLFCPHRSSHQIAAVGVTVVPVSSCLCRCQKAVHSCAVCLIADHHGATGQQGQGKGTDPQYRSITRKGRPVRRLSVQAAAAPQQPVSIAFSRYWLQKTPPGGG